MKAVATKPGITLYLSTDEAIALEAILGGMKGNLAQLVPGWYDRIADALETRNDVVTVSHAVEQRYRYFGVDATQYDSNNASQIYSGPLENNPVVSTYELSTGPWQIREYQDGHFDAHDAGGIALSPGFDSFADALKWACEQEAARRILEQK